MQYALGRSISFRDQQLVDRMVSDAKSNNFAIRSFIHTLVLSEEFRSK
jgi:hypothetical protein